jgi:hypothetical protein
MLWSIPSFIDRFAGSGTIPIMVRPQSVIPVERIARRIYHEYDAAAMRRHCARRDLRILELISRSQRTAANVPGFVTASSVNATRGATLS